jgi:hypothetical protein
MECISMCDDEDIHCPYCQKLLVTSEDESYETCKHILFIALVSHDFEYVHEKYAPFLKNEHLQCHNFYEYIMSLPFAGKVFCVAGPFGEICVYWVFLEHIS